MGEIKSTLDLVMERTRHLSQSEEEKTRQRREDFGKRLQGLLQQHTDGILSKDALKDRMEDLRSALKVDDQRALITSIAGRIDPDRDNRRWLDLLGDLAPTACVPLETALDDYEKKKHQRLQEGIIRQRQWLASAHGIKGAAVTPNALNDGDCIKALSALRQQFDDRLQSIVNPGALPDQT